MNTGYTPTRDWLHEEIARLQRVAAENKESAPIRAGDLMGRAEVYKDIANLVRPNALIHETQTKAVASMLFSLFDGPTYASSIEFAQAKRDAAIFGLMVNM